jgi:hypothetical protein
MICRPRQLDCIMTNGYPNWVDPDELDPDSAVVMGLRACLISLLVSACIWPIMVITLPVTIPLCTIGAAANLSVWVFHTLSHSSIAGVRRGLRFFRREFLREFPKVFLDLKDAFFDSSEE